MSSEQGQTHPTPTNRLDYRPPDYLIDGIRLEFDLEPEVTRVVAIVSMHRVSQQGDSPPLRLDGDGLVLKAIRMNDRPLDQSALAIGSEGLTVFSPPSEFTLEIETEIYPAKNSRLEGLFVSNGMFCTQCEAEGFRRITYFPDRPDVLTRYTTVIRADKTAYPILLSNGNLTEKKPIDGNRHMAVWHDPFPKPSYLFALVAGDLGCLSDTFRTTSGRDVALQIFAEHGSESRCGYAMESLKRAMRWDEVRFGLEYDLDVFNIVAVSDFNMGAMENKSLNIFNSKYILADPETATDDDYSNIESIVAHEYFHNWSGNRVTCRDWFQLSLKEGLTVFRDREFSGDMRSPAVKRIQDVRGLRSAQFSEDASPLSHPVRPDSYVEINNFYTATVYEKGAEVIGMMQTLLGREGFSKGLKLYFSRHDGQAVTCDDFVQAMEDATATDLGQFRLWYSQAGTPRVDVRGSFDETTGRYDLTLVQHIPPTPGQDVKMPMMIPLRLSLLGENGVAIPLRGDAVGREDWSETTLVLSKTQATYSFEGLKSRPVVSINRGFSAPVKLVNPMTAADEFFLLANDDDPFNRWESAQQLATRLLLAAVAAIQRGEQPSFDTRIVEALDKCAEQASLDPAFMALTLSLPSEDFLAQQMDVIDVDAIHAARQGLRLDIALGMHDSLERLYAGTLSNEPYSPDASSAGRRALRNTALGYLVVGEGLEGVSRAHSHYDNADNMTDRMAAMRVLVDIASASREYVVADFADRFRGNALVMDKWFALQAISSLPDTLTRVGELMKHEGFRLSNPNKVRSLIGTFASGNALRFHAPDGRGYRFLADKILELDPLNPQVAARLLTPMGRWRRFDEKRRGLMKAELLRIARTENLSRDVYEIATKILGE